MGSKVQKVVARSILLETSSSSAWSFCDPWFPGGQNSTAKLVTHTRTNQPHFFYERTWIIEDTERRHFGVKVQCGSGTVSQFEIAAKFVGQTIQVPPSSVSVGMPQIDVLAGLLLLAGTWGAGGGAKEAPPHVLSFSGIPFLAPSSASFYWTNNKRLLE